MAASRLTRGAKACSIGTALDRGTLSLALDDRQWLGHGPDRVNGDHDANRRFAPADVLASNARNPSGYSCQSAGAAWTINARRTGLEPVSDGSKVCPRSRPRASTRRYPVALWTCCASTVPRIPRFAPRVAPREIHKLLCISLEVAAVDVTLGYPPGLADHRGEACVRGVAVRVDHSD